MVYPYLGKAVNSDVDQNKTQLSPYPPNYGPYPPKSNLLSSLRTDNSLAANEILLPGCWSPQK